MRHMTAIFALLFLAPHIALAADGDECEPGEITYPLASTGQWVPYKCIDVCDGKAAADSSCTEFDMNTVGHPDLIVFEREDNDGSCSATPDISVKTGSTTGGTPAYEIASTPVVIDDDPNRVVIDAQGGYLSRYLFFAITDNAACTDLDLRMFLINRKD